MADILTVADLESAKLDDTFHAEVITGKLGGNGADIDFATHARTWQVQMTLPAMIRNYGFGNSGLEFGGGGSLNSPSLLVKYNTNNSLYRYIGTGAFPVAIPAAPDANWQEFAATIHEVLGGKNHVGAHDEIYYRTTTVAELASSAFTEMGIIVRVADRGGELFKLTASTVADGKGKLDAGNGNAAVVHPIEGLAFEAFGLTEAATDQSQKFLDAIAFAEANDIRDVYFRSTKTVYMANTAEIPPLLAARYSVSYDTSTKMTIHADGVVFKPLVSNLVMIRNLREHLRFTALNGHNNGFGNIELIQNGSDSNIIWEANPELYRGSYGHLTIDNLSTTGLYAGLRFKPLSITAGNIGNYYHHLGTVNFAHTLHGIIFDNCPTGDNQTTRTHINTLSHHGGSCSLVCSNVETLTVDSYHAENLNEVSTEFPDASQTGVWVPRIGDGQLLRNHRIKVTGSTENVPFPYKNYGESCELNIYPVSYDVSGWDQGEPAASGYGGMGAMPNSGSLNDFFFIYHTSRQAVVGIALGSPAAASLPSGLGGQCYGNIQWLSCSNIMTDEGVQVLNAYFPFVSTWHRKVKVIDRDNATFQEWVRMDAASGVLGQAVPIDTFADNLTQAGYMQVYTVQYTAANGAAQKSPNGGEFYGIIEWKPGPYGDGVHLAYGTFPPISRRRQLVSGVWSTWVDL